MEGQWFFVSVYSCDYLCFAMQQCLDDSHFVSDICRHLWFICDVRGKADNYTAYSTMEPQLSRPRLSGLVSLVLFFFFFLMNITRCDLEKLKQKFITPSKREFKTLFLICFALNKREQHKMNNYSDAFSWILNGWIVMLLRECHAWFRVGYVNTRPIAMSTKRI